MSIKTITRIAFSTLAASLIFASPLSAMTAHHQCKCEHEKHGCEHSKKVNCEITGKHGKKRHMMVQDSRTCAKKHGKVIKKHHAKHQEQHSTKVANQKEDSMTDSSNSTSSTGTNDKEMMTTSSTPASDAAPTTTAMEPAADSSSKEMPKD